MHEYLVKIRELRNIATSKQLYVFLGRLQDRQPKMRAPHYGEVTHKSETVVSIAIKSRK
jgi:hypothetical protein